MGSVNAYLTKKQILEDLGLEDVAGGSKLSFNFNADHFEVSAKNTSIFGNITIPSHHKHTNNIIYPVTVISDNAFTGCLSVNSITIESTNVIGLGSNAIPANISRIYVPLDSLSAYKAATGWSGFANKIVAIPDDKYVSDNYVKKAGDTISGNLVISGNLTVAGTTTSVESTSTAIRDTLLELGKGNSAAITTPAGMYVTKYNGSSNGALVFDNTGTAYVGDCVLDNNGNIDVNNSDLQPLATRSNSTDLIDGQVMVWDANNSKLVGSNSYVKNTDIATPTKPGICKIGAGGNGITLVDNMATIMLAAKLHLDNRGNQYSVINSGRYDYAVKKALTDNEHAPHSGDFAAVWTNDDRQKARILLGAAGELFYSTEVPTVIETDTSYDLTATALTTVILNVPATPPNKFQADMMVTTGETAALSTNITKFKGRDCYSDGTFAIQPNTNYYINFMKYGNQIIGIVATI